MSDSVLVHSAVILTGHHDGLADVHQELSPEFHCHHYRDDALLVADVTVGELKTINNTAAQHGVVVDRVQEPHQVRLAADDEPAQNLDPIPDPEAIDQPSQPKLELLEGGWYKTNQDDLPLLHVIKVWNEVQPDGILLWLFNVDMVAADAMPQPATLSAEQLKKYSPEPASLDDFEKLDIIPPAGFEPTPHVIPSVEQDIEDMGDEIKEAGVSLPTAQMAAMLLQSRLGRAGVTEIAQTAQGGFYVQARLHRKVLNAPAEIGGARVHYK